MLSDPFMENRVDKRTSLKPGYLCGKLTDCSEGLFIVTHTFIAPFPNMDMLKNKKTKKQNKHKHTTLTIVCFKNVVLWFVFQKSCLLK